MFSFAKFPTAKILIKSENESVILAFYDNFTYVSIRRQETGGRSADDYLGDRSAGVAGVQTMVLVGGRLILVVRSSGVAGVQTIALAHDIPASSASFFTF